MAGISGGDAAGRDRLGRVGLRVLVATLMFIHGTYRLKAGGVAPLGSWLSELGFPGGSAIAWGITLFEIIGGALLAAGIWVVPLALVLMVELAMGIALVHAPEGWFVVGGGRNGMEYSVLLIGALAVVALQHKKGER